MTTHTTSNRKPATWSSPILALALALLGPGCDALSASPGHDFGLTVLSPTPLTLVGKITAPIRFAVTGCTAFDTAVRTGDAGSHGVDVAPQADGTWLATVPVEWVREEDRTCLDDALAPHLSQAQLLVTCRDAGRTAAAVLEVSYATATRAYFVNERGYTPQESVRYVFPGLEPLQPIAMGVSGLQPSVNLFPLHWHGLLWPDGNLAIENPLVQPRLVTTPSSLFYSAGVDPSGTSPVIVLSPSKILVSERLVGRTLAGGLPPSLPFDAWVPARVVDLAFAADGAVLVLSSELDASGFSPVAVVLSRVDVDAATGAANVTVIGYFSDEHVQTRFSRTVDGRLAFLSLAFPASEGPIRSMLHTTDGVSVVTLADPTGGLDLGTVYPWGTIITRGLVQLSPDGALLVDGDGYVGAPGAAMNSLPTTASYQLDGDRAGAAWPTGAVALWSGSSFIWQPPPAQSSTGSVQVFDEAPPHARRYAYAVEPLPGSGPASQLFGATAVGDKLVLTTNTGMRVLGSDGALVGGADPLPCGLEPTALAVQVGPTTAAVGAGDYLYVFDLADPAP